MQIGMIENATRIIGKSQGYLGLPVRDVLIDEAVNGPQTPVMETAWFPTPREMADLSAGAPVILQIIGTQHPPVLLIVGDRP